jgi:hypothetical protein
MRIISTLTILASSFFASAMSQQLLQLHVDKTTIIGTYDLKSDRGNSVGFSPTNGFYDAIYAGKNKDGKWVLALQKNKDKFYFLLPDDPTNFNNREITAAANQTSQNMGLTRTVDHYVVSPIYTDYDRQPCQECRTVCRRTRRGDECRQECYNGWRETRIDKRDHDVDGSVKLISATGAQAAEVTFRDRLVEILRQSTSACY